MSQVDRKRIELKRKAQSLAEEFGKWLAVSEKGQPLEKHHSQIRRITKQLTSACEQLLDGIEAMVDDAALLDNSYEFEQQILEIHRIWGFFRDKFALRHMDWFQPFLAVADEFAWHCYRPASTKAVEANEVAADAVKEPPLTFFTGSSTPFAMSRNASYRSEIPPENGIGIVAFSSLLKALPISVIGLPWFQLAHLPDAVVIGHETGHNVEDDLGLTEILQNRLSACLNEAVVPIERQEAWQAWLGEIFADIYGTLATGAAYAGAQADFLSDASGDIMTEDPRGYGGWGFYPTTYLRMLIVFEALDCLGYGDESTGRLSKWKAKYPAHALVEFEPDVPVVVNAILDGETIGGLALKKVLAFSKNQFDKAKADASNVLNGYSPEGTQVRALFATARLAFEKDPDKYFTSNAQQLILDKILKTIKAGTRSGIRSSLAHEGKLELHDVANGKSLLAQIAAMKNP